MEGTQRPHMKKNGEWQDMVVYGILRSEYKGQ
jgi:RimJ/RimL family protein N-acetyltransferase